MAISLFPTKRKMYGHVQWPPLPYEPEVIPGEQFSALFSGMLYRMNLDTVDDFAFDNLHACHTNQDQFLEDISYAMENLFSRYNMDVVESMAQLRHTFQNLSTEVEACSERTQIQVDMLQELVSQVDFDENEIILNLAQEREHVELKMAHIKLAD